MTFEKHKIQLWLFEEAPTELRLLSENGGDEDWVMFVPERLEDDHRVMSMVEASAFDKSCAPEEHEVDGGWVFIGCHA